MLPCPWPRLVRWGHRQPGCRWSVCDLGCDTRPGLPCSLLPPMYMSSFLTSSPDIWSKVRPSEETVAYLAASYRRTSKLTPSCNSTAKRVTGFRPAEGLRGGFSCQPTSVRGQSGSCYGTRPEYRGERDFDCLWLFKDLDLVLRSRLDMG